ncbi:flagellar hook-length control protein FliK [Bradyrhizobium sp. CCBAU 53351]|uniref:flagellar hook-length control protein FliK n=1 Tax=Bradyrhizobium sp. CCBAU 53351 TaxID=1325114 RepID=UPI0018884914|nr:flagellar hook-length control protein FliK [Bradyrhizobium sp. CCBAU 53351]QOZ79239.1 flagellar hook-length control protein FliK [Bradyrhizobium sp. CCBAU 53351]
MTKLNGTSGQLFSGLAESLNIRGSSRGTKSAGAKSQAGSSFNDLLHTVSNLAKQALKDDGSDTTAKAATLRPHLAHPTEKEKKNVSVHELKVASERPEPTEEASDEKVDRLAEKHRPIDHAAKADVQDPSGTAVVVGQEIAAAPAVKPQMQSQAAEKDAPAREERSSTTKREVQGAGKAATADTAPSNVTPAAARAQAAASQAAAAPQSLPAQASEPSGAMPATTGFEAVSANVERAAKAAGRDALPETTKVTVVQQETHLPPAQFNAPQQVANAVVTELKDSAGPTAPAALDLAASQTNAPDQPLKILTINLEPPALGNVIMRLRLVGTEVSIHLAAERRDTSQMLDQQRDQIRDLMQSAGYVADVAPVQHGSLDGFQSGSGQSQPQLPSQQQPSSQSQGTFDGGGTSSGQSDGGARQARQERRSNQETRHDQELGQPNRRGPVYL